MVESTTNIAIISHLKSQRIKATDKSSNSAHTKNFPTVFLRGTFLCARVRARHIPHLNSAHYRARDERARQKEWNFCPGKIHVAPSLKISNKQCEPAKLTIPENITFFRMFVCHMNLQDGMICKNANNHKNSMTTEQTVFSCELSRPSMFCMRLYNNLLDACVRMWNATKVESGNDTHVLCLSVCASLPLEESALGLYYAPMVVRCETFLSHALSVPFMWRVVCVCVCGLTFASQLYCCICCIKVI